MRVTTYYFFTRQVFPFKLVNAKHESKLSLGFKLLFCDTFWLGQNICSPCNSRSIDHSRRLSVLSGASQSSQIFLNLKRRTTGGRRGLSFDEASRVVEMESKDPKKDESTQKNECSGQEWIELSASPLNEKGSSGGNNPEYVDVGKNGRHTHASKKTKRKKKRGYAKTPLDWSNIDQSEAQRHVGYVDFSDWLVDHQKIESVPCEASSDKTPENAPQKVEQFIPGVQAHKNHLPETPAIDATNVPESVRQYERQLKKQRAAARVARPITMEALRIVYIDKDIVVANKSSGTLTVPGVRGNPSLAQIVYDAFGCESGRVAKTIVHRLDMDTSGLVVFAKTNAALSELHRSFRDFEISKTYEALVCGHLAQDEGEIVFPLQRDHKFPPWMRVSTKESEKEAAEVVKDLQHAGWKAMIRKAPKQSETRYKVMSREYFEGEPITRLALTPVTGRTHQLRVHCAAIGHHIVADQTYGFLGEAAEGGGLSEEVILADNPTAASPTLQQNIDTLVRKANNNLCLHAKKLCLPHPTTGKLMIFEAPPPF